jgi:hypothetical protein
MSPAKKGRRFGYLADAAQPTPDERPTQDEGAEEPERAAALSTKDGGGEGGDGTRRSRNARRDSQEGHLRSVPKGQGRMKQERSQLNVRIPTSLKRRASAKAVLEGKDIGEVIEELLREYLDR